MQSTLLHKLAGTSYLRHQRSHRCAGSKTSGMKPRKQMPRRAREFSTPLLTLQPTPRSLSALPSLYPPCCSSSTARCMPAQNFVYPPFADTQVLRARNGQVCSQAAKLAGMAICCVCMEAIEHTSRYITALSWCHSFVSFVSHRLVLSRLCALYVPAVELRAPSYAEVL